MPVTDFVDQFIRKAWRDIGQAPNLPPFELAACQDDETGEPVVIFATTGTEPVFLTPEQAQEVAQGLRALLDGANPRFTVSARCSGFHARFIGERKGRGFVLKIADNLDRDTKAVRVSGLSVSIAEDLADAFDDAATKAVALMTKATA